jgi:hypothetical protein
VHCRHVSPAITTFNVLGNSIHGEWRGPHCL